MFVFLICILTLHQVHSVCVVPEICPENTTVQAEIVDVHNAFRRVVQPSASDMLKMSYSEEAAATAQAWVDKCILAHGEPSTRMLDGYQMGENLFYSTRPHTWTSVIEAWHCEVSNYLYPNGSINGNVVGHYTQVVWNSSYKIGCGVAQCKGIYFYGCHYYRAGNFKGALPYMSGPPCAACPNDCEDKLCTNPCPYVDQYTNCPSLKKSHSCSHPLVYKWCPASCKCETEIIPVA